MKESKKLALVVTLACAVWGATATTAMAATEAQKLAAIEDGLSYLYANQQAGGYWNYGGYEPAATGAAVLAFVSQQGKWGPNAANYQAAVDKAVKYLLDSATKTTVSTRNDGVNICPGGSGNCTAVYWNAANNEDSYTTGIIAPAIATYAAGKAGEVATTTGPLAGMKWGEIAQANTNLWSASQSTALQGVLRGGWRYILGAGGYDSDMSTTQWGIISFIYNETLGAATPAIVKTDLAAWLAFAQAVSGAGCYQGPASGICDHSETGGLLLGLRFVGKPTSDPAVQSALNFLNTNWQQLANNIWYGNFNQPYAMWAVYKGLEVNIGLQNTATITNLLTTCGYPGNPPGSPPGSVPCNWWEDYNEHLVTTQNGDGSWTGYSYWYGPLATAWYVNILGATRIFSEITFTKVVDGGSAQPDNWTFTVDGQQVNHNGKLELSKGAQYTLTEQGPSDYQLVDASGDCVLTGGQIILTVPNSDVGTCVVTNRAPVATPALSPLGLVILSGLLGVLGVFGVRMRRRSV